MDSSIKKLEKSILEITIKESKENIAKYRKTVLKHLRQNADIKGFRKGVNIPDEIILKNYWEERIYELVIDEALKYLYSKALKDNGVVPVAQGELVEIVSQDPLEVKLHVEVFPEVEIREDYKNVKLTKTLVFVSDIEVDEEIKNIQTRFTRFEKAWEGYVAQMGDKMTIDTIGYDLAGNKLESTEMQSYPLSLGSNILVPWFEEGLVGKQAGETVELDVAFPKDYHNADFAWKQTKFQVTIHSIDQAIVPEFSPEFIKDLRGKDVDFAGFKEIIRQEIFERKETDARIKDENALIEKLAELTTVEFGVHLVQQQVERVYAEIKDNISQSGAKVSDYIESLGLDEEWYIQTQVTPIARRRLLAEFILHKLLELEKIEVEEAELTIEIDKILARYGSPEVVERLKELYKPETKYYVELKQRLSYRKLIDSFLV